MLTCILLDVGGTLWPDAWPAPAKVSAARVANLGAVLRAFGLNAALAPVLQQCLLAAMVEHARQGRQSGSLIQDTASVVQGALREVGLAPDPMVIAAIRRAMRVSPAGYAELLPGARELLAAIRALDLRCVAISNAHWRDGDDYRQDFADLGVAHYFDAVISPVDVGYNKPHRAMFDAALAAGGWRAAHCVMIGNSEHNDVEPARALSMRTILVALEEDPPAVSSADDVALTLADVAATLRAWVAAEAAADPRQVVDDARH
ncbi:MAG: HAD family hydrolase [Thermomicrobiales bacterium]